MAKTGNGKKRLRGGLRKAVSCAAAAALALAMTPSAAFANDLSSTYYALPTSSQVISFNHTGTDSSGNSYNYQYVTIGSSATGRVAPMAQTYYEVLGLNYINAYRGVDSVFNAPSTATDWFTASNDNINTNYTQGSIGSLQTRNSTLAIMGTSNNENPDEYIWNYLCWANGANVSQDSMAIDHGNSSTGAVSVTIGSTEYADFPREVYTECNIIAASSSTAKYGSNSWLKWVKLENQRDSRPKTGTYDPYFATYSVTSGGAATMVKGLYALADTIDEIIDDSVDTNGNYTLQSRYGGNTSGGTAASISKYEDIVQAPQYYVLSKLHDGTLAKKAVTAVLVGYDPDTGNYACRKWNTSYDPDGNQYGGRVANYLSSISTSITDLGLPTAQNAYSSTEDAALAWYTPAQIVENCDAAFVCDCYSANTVSTYLATATDGKPHTVYTPADVSHAVEDNTGGLISARTAALGANSSADVCDFCFSYPGTMFGNFYAQGVENGMISLIAASFTYPELNMNLTDMLGYWAKNVWHIKSDSVQSIVTGLCGGMALSGNTTIGTLSSDYETSVQNFLNEGNKFYIAHQEQLDAFNGGNLATYDLADLKTRVEVTTDNDGGDLGDLAKQTATITASDMTKSLSDGTFNLGATGTGGALSYTSGNTAVAEVDSSGNVTPKSAGTAQITITSAATTYYAAATKTVTVTITENAATQTIKASKASRSVKYSKVKKKKVTVKGITVSNASGKVTYTKVKVNKNAKKFTVNKTTGKITVKKGTKKGTYKVTVRATDSTSATAQAIVTIKVK